MTNEIPRCYNCDSEIYIYSKSLVDLEGNFYCDMECYTECNQDTIEPLEEFYCQYCDKLINPGSGDCFFHLKDNINICKKCAMGVVGLTKYLGKEED